VIAGVLSGFEWVDVKQYGVADEDVVQFCAVARVQQGEQLFVGGHSGSIILDDELGETAEGSRIHNNNNIISRKEKQVDYYELKSK
jgi:hypothetical protein